MSLIVRCASVLAAASLCVASSCFAADRMAPAVPVVPVDQALTPGGLDQLDLPTMEDAAIERILRERRKRLLGYVQYDPGQPRPIFVFDGDRPGQQYLVEFAVGQIVRTRGWGPLTVSGKWPGMQGQPPWN